MIYRPDIDGLRAIAVLGVIFFHADFGCDGGFVGVDVFFVISGFLITSLIIKDLRAGNFSILGFWERRARRIFPALFVVTIATIIFGYFLLLPRDFELLGRSVLWLSLFTSNVFFWRNTNSYFSGSAEEMPLLHTWSLSLEEQFYLVVPFALLLLFKWRKSSGLMWIVSLGVLLSLLMSVLGTMRYESASFYLLTTRAWELGVGSMVALSKPLRSYPLKSAMAFVGILCVLVPFFIYDRSIPFPGLFAIPPVLGSALLILSGQNTKISDPVPMVTRILSIKPLVFIGLLSYSLYLWHWPLLAFNEYLVIGKNSLLIKSILILISFLLAFVLPIYDLLQLMETIDWIILLGTLSFIVIFGIWKNNSHKNIQEYLKGGNKARWWTVGLSVMATQASAITFLSTPGQAYHDGMGFVQFYFGLPFAMLIICLFFIPVYHRLKVYTAYEFLENRFDLRVRTLTAILFLIQRGLAAGITIYAPAIILSVVLGWNLKLMVLLVGVLAVSYTLLRAHET